MALVPATPASASRSRWPGGARPRTHSRYDKACYCTYDAWYDMMWNNTTYVASWKKTWYVFFHESQEILWQAWEFFLRAWELVFSVLRDIFTFRRHRLRVRLRYWGFMYANVFHVSENVFTQQLNVFWDHTYYSINYLESRCFILADERI